MKHVYGGFKDGDDAPDPCRYVDESEDYGRGGQYPEVDTNEMIRAAPQGIDNDAAFECYQRLHPYSENATQEAFIVDSYVDGELFELYFAETSPTAIAK